MPAPASLFPSGMRRGRSRSAARAAPPARRAGSQARASRPSVTSWSSAIATRCTGTWMRAGSTRWRSIDSDRHRKFRAGSRRAKFRAACAAGTAPLRSAPCRPAADRRRKSPLEFRRASGRSSSRARARARARRTRRRARGRAARSRAGCCASRSRARWLRCAALIASTVPTRSRRGFRRARAPPCRRRRRRRPHAGARSRASRRRRASAAAWSRESTAGKSVLPGQRRRARAARRASRCRARRSGRCRAAARIHELAATSRARDRLRIADRAGRRRCRRAPRPPARPGGPTSRQATTARSCATVVVQRSLGCRAGPGCTGSGRARRGRRVRRRRKAVDSAFPGPPRCHGRRPSSCGEPVGARSHAGRPPGREACDHSSVGDDPPPSAGLGTVPNSIFGGCPGFFGPEPSAGLDERGQSSRARARQVKAGACESARNALVY